MANKSPLQSKVVQAALDKERWRSRLSFWAAATFLGLICVFFAALCQWADQSFRRIYEISPYLPFLVCPLGFYLVWKLQTSIFPGAEGSGIPQVVASLQSRSTLLKNQLLNMRIFLGKILCTTLGLLSGASIGREGPSVHIGASLFHSLGHIAQFSRFDRRQGLIVAGAAAGISAAFNAPLAGIVFAIEELKGSFEERSSGLMLSAVILAGLVSLALLGHYTHFGRVNTQVNSLEHIVPVVLISVSGGLFGGYFSRMILYWSPRLPNIKVPRHFLIPVFIGLLIATIGFFSKGESFGSGHHQTQMLLQDPDNVSLLYPFWKILSTLGSYLAGLSGGVFAPSLSIGAGLGASLSPLFPLIDVKALIVIGMVSYLSAVVRAPVTAFVIVFEMTSNHLILIPLMAASFIATGISKLICPKSLYRGLSERFSSRSKTISE